MTEATTLDVAELRSALRLTDQRLESGLLAFAASVQALQADVSWMRARVDLVATQQHEIQTHGDGIANLTREIKEANRLHQAVADKVTHWRGWIMGIGASLSLIILLAGGFFSAIISRESETRGTGFTQAATERARLERTQAEDAARLERRTDGLAADIRELQQAGRLK